MSRASRRGLLTCLLLAAAAGLSAQEPTLPAPASPLRVSSAVAPETVTVGERFRSVLQVVTPPGASVDFSPLAVGDTMQPVDSVRVIPGRAGEPPIAAYSLVAWVAGAPLRAQASVRVELADGGAATYLVPLRLPVVRSVLPEDTAGVEPRPARAPLALPDAGAPRWPWLLAIAVLLLLAAAGVMLLRWRPPAAPPAELSARDRALAALGRIAADPAAHPDADGLYAAVTRVLRGYASELNGAWSPDLTTRELLERLREHGVAEGGRDALRALLQHADRVKFARYSPEAGEIDRFLAGAREWVLAYPPGGEMPPDEREAA